MLKPAQTKLVERWKFLTALALALISTIGAIAIALSKHDVKIGRF